MKDHRIIIEGRTLTKEEVKEILSHSDSPDLWLWRNGKAYVTGNMNLTETGRKILSWITVEGRPATGIVKPVFGHWRAFTFASKKRKQ